MLKAQPDHRGHKAQPVLRAQLALKVKPDHKVILAPRAQREKPALRVPPDRRVKLVRKVPRGHKELPELTQQFPDHKDPKGTPERKALRVPKEPRLRFPVLKVKPAHKEQKGRRETLGLEEILVVRVQLDLREK